MEESEKEKKIKIDSVYLDKINKNEDVLQYFGDWINHTEEIKTQFLSGLPFENIVIDNFLEQSYAEKLYQLFPSDFENWYHYENPIEVKYAFDHIDELPLELKKYFYYLSSDQISKKITEITNIPDLEYDEYLHGAGLHSHPRYGRLNIHLDYEKHPYSGKERRINIIYFLSKEWQESWNGNNELWDQEAMKCVKKTQVKFNRAIIFKTNDISWHGLPEKIMCPENIFRKSLAYYYVSPLNTAKEEQQYRRKAKFVKRPEDPKNTNMGELYEIRRHRRITINDMKRLFPNWKKET
jgi:Rps23 Pro-64 3,4-dihydroxylase Tpa1-like proline 4-hydroxylase